MPKLQKVEGQDLYLFNCPGCDSSHGVTVNGERNSMNATWQWNGSIDTPTFSPSLLIRTGHFAQDRHPCWCDYNREHPQEPSPFTCGVCHSFIRDGNIQFLRDCTHSLAGQTVPIPEWK